MLKLIILEVIKIENHMISHIYQSIRTFEESSVLSGAEDRFYFEPLVTHFSKLMEAYQALEEER